MWEECYDIAGTDIITQADTRIRRFGEFEREHLLTIYAQSVSTPYLNKRVVTIPKQLHAIIDGDHMTVHG